MMHKLDLLFMLYSSYATYGMTSTPKQGFVFIKQLRPSGINIKREASELTVFLKIISYMS
jgi:hypothetical protein